MKAMRTVVMGLTVSALGACGGGGDDSAAPDTGTPPPPAVTTTSVSVKVIDGAIGNALVCMDKNDNGICDMGEPFARTNAAGQATLDVAIADAGKYPMLALAGTDAVDADHGAVLVPFAMKAPADQAAVISPLTTLVQAYKATSGSTTAAAEAAVQAQTGITVSLFQDFTSAAAKASSAGVFAGDLARLVVLTTQTQAEALRSTVGTAALDNKNIGNEDITRLIQQRLLEILPNIAQAVADAAGDANKDATLSASASAIVTSATTGIATASVAVGVAANNAATGVAGQPEPPVANVALRQLNYPDSDNWLVRASRVSAAQAMLTNGLYTSAADRQSMSSGNLVRWGFGRNASRNSDLHFNGTAWSACGFPTLSRNSMRDSAGRSTYNLCEGYEVGNSASATFSVAGRKMIDVYNQLEGYGNITITSAASVLGSAAFPAGSTVRLSTDVPVQTALAYAPGRSNRVVVTNAAVSAGKTSASDATAACALITASTPSGDYQTEAATLEEMVQRNLGTPCVYSQGSTTITLASGSTASVSSGARNDWWGQSSLALGVFGSATTGGAQTGYYTTNTLLRVGFAATGNAVKYYACQQRSTDGSPRNCDLLGEGTFSIATLGDGRVMRFTNLPTLASSLTYEYVVVERGGKVYLGYKNKPIAVTSARLNKAGANALLQQLGVATLDEEEVPTTTPGSFAGNYDVIQDGIYVTRIFVGAAGQVTGCQDIELPPHAFEPCTGSVSATGVLTAVYSGLNDAGGVARLALDFLAGTGVGTFTPNAGPVENLLAIRR